MLSVQAAVHVDLGDWRKAVESVEEGVQLANDTGQPNWSTGVTAVEAMIAALTGDVDKANRIAAEVEAASSTRVINDALCNAQLARGFAFLSAGKHADAYAALKPVFDPKDPHHHRREALSGVMFLAEAAARSGQHDDVRPIIEDLELTATVTSSPVLAMHLRYARAVLADEPTAEARHLEGLSCDLNRWPWIRARLQLSYGSWLRRQRRVAESRDPLRAALATFELIGASAWIEEARGELRATGARSDAPDDLAQESSILQLSAQEATHRPSRRGRAVKSGRSASKLYLSPRTVGSHLYHMFPKLGIRNRAQLSARLNTQ